MATIITIEDVKKARDYMPVETKEAVARLMSKLCVRIEENDAAPDGTVLPPMRIEDRIMRLKCLHGVLAGWYFGSKFDVEKLRYRDGDGREQTRDVALCMNTETLDDWLSGHPMNQLERLKKEKQIANKVYDILYDFRVFELMLNGAIRDEIDKGNDPALRMAQVLATQASPDNLRETLEVMQEYRTKMGVADDA